MPKFSMYTEVDGWDICFSYNTHITIIHALNPNSFGSLTFPRDAERLVALLPLECWPQFAVDAYNRHMRSLTAPGQGMLV